MRKITILVACVASVVGCTTPIRYEGARHVSQDHVVTRSYQLGVPKTVSVGEAIVKVEDYWADISEQPVALPTKSFTVKGGPVALVYEQGKEYPVRGLIAVEGKDYAVVPNSSNPSGYSAALVSPDGSIYNRVVGTNPNLRGDHVMVVYTMTIDPSDAKLVRQRSQTVNMTKGFINYEILYTGTSANAINLTYREFSPEGAARVAFFQNLTYPADAKSITFKQLRIAVDRATADGITFTVVADGPK